MDNTSGIRYIGIDYLRAFFSICVVVWHENGFTQPDINNYMEFSRHAFSVSDFMNYHVLLAAVPSFFLISSFLYIAKNRTTAYLKQRVYNLCLLTLFWAVLLTVYAYNYNGLYELVPKSPGEAAVIFLTAGSTPYYFFISLCFVTILTHFANKLSTRANIVLLLISLFILTFSPFIAIKAKSWYLTVFWNPMNFLSYPFAAIVIYRFHNQLHELKKRYQWGIFILLIVIAALAAISEWRYYLDPIFLCGQKIALPVYTRPSVLISSAAFLLTPLLIGFPSNPIISFMSKYSMALYCLHAFSFRILYNPAHFPSLSKSIWIVIMLSIGLSYLMAIALRVFIKDKYIITVNNGSS
ncbi:MAG: acyltransferase family protein [Nitrospirae bacterium]|nr:acyltransferase family protein [Nitrospirota bacterium]